MHKFIIKTDDVGRTILKYLIKMLPNVPISKIHKVFRQEDIKINNQRKIKPTYSLKLGDEIIVYGLTDIGQRELSLESEVNFKTLYEDNNIIAVSKKVNDEVHGNENSLDYQVLTYLKFKPESSFTPSHINRLDKPTSGIVVYAKNYKTLVQMKAKVQDFVKIYVFKSNLTHSGTVQIRLTHSEDLEREIVLKQGGKLAITKFWNQGNQNYAQLLTGRKHQIRATLSYLKDPILGDKKYGGKPAKRLFLHATRLIFKNLTGDLEYLNEHIIDDNPHW